LRRTLVLFVFQAAKKNESIILLPSKKLEVFKKVALSFAVQGSDTTMLKAVIQLASSLYYLIFISRKNTRF
jgi:hypothetical protein